MIRPISILSAFIAASAVLSACTFGGPPNPGPVFQPFPGQGQYVRPDYLAPQPTPFIPAIDECRSRLYVSLVGRHEGAIFFPGLPGRIRVTKPAQLEGFGYNIDDSFYTQPPLLEVREFLAGQALYASSISNLSGGFNLGPEMPDRLTIELNDQGIVQEVSCG